MTLNDDTKTISISGITKTEIALTNTIIVPSYTDGVDGHVATFQNYVGQNAYPYVWVLNAFGYLDVLQRLLITIFSIKMVLRIGKINMGLPTLIDLT